MVVYLLIAVLLLVLEWVYFKIADKFNIIDKPNLRSSHSTIVLRGGGIIFLFGAWLYAAFYGFTCPWFLLGLTMLGGIRYPLPFGSSIGAVSTNGSESFVKKPSTNRFA